MKKLALMLLFALPMGMFLYSCDSTNDDDLDDGDNDSTVTETLTLDKDSVAVKVDEMFKLTASLDSCTWRSSDTKVAVIAALDSVGHEYAVTGISEGSAIITVTKGDLEATCKVTVLAPDPLVLSQDSVAVNVGDNFELTATLENCTWESSNSFIAKIDTVDNKQVIKGVHVGSAVITAVKGDQRATCKVTVNATNNNFTIPVLEWGSTAATIKGMIKDLTLYSETADLLTYTTNGDFPIYMYAFKDKALAASTLAVDQVMDEEKDLMGFLEQRYTVVEEDEVSFTYANAPTLTDATLAVVYQYDAESESIIATWAPIQHTRSGKAVVNKELHRKHVNMVRNFVKNHK